MALLLSTIKRKIYVYECVYLPVDDPVQLLDFNELEYNDAVDAEKFSLFLPLATVSVAPTIPFDIFPVLVTVDDFLLILFNSSSSSGSSASE